MKDCPLCQLQGRVQEAIRRGVRPDRVEKYLQGTIADDMDKLNAKVKAEGLL